MNSSAPVQLRLRVRASGTSIQTTASAPARTAMRSTYVPRPTTPTCPGRDLRVIFAPQTPSRRSSSRMSWPPPSPRPRADVARPAGATPVDAPQADPRAALARARRRRRRRSAGTEIRRCSTGPVRRRQAPDRGTARPLRLPVSRRDGGIRTHDLPLPKRTRYQPAPHPGAPDQARGPRRVHVAPSHTRYPGCRGPGCAAAADADLCGRSSMVEPQSSKLATRVRFPSSAPLVTARHGRFLRRSRATMVLASQLLDSQADWRRAEFPEN